MPALPLTAVTSSVVSQLGDTSSLNGCPSPTLAPGICCLDACLSLSLSFSLPSILPYLPLLPTHLPSPLPSKLLHGSPCQALGGCWGPRGDGTVVPVLKELPIFVSLSFLCVLTSDSLTSFLLCCLHPLVWGLPQTLRNTSQELTPTFAFQSQELDLWGGV